jgi:predicted phage terminase large subunit-like protein
VAAASADGVVGTPSVVVTGPSSNPKSKIQNPKSDGSPPDSGGVAAASADGVVGTPSVVVTGPSSNPKSKIQNPKSDDPLGRQPGEALCPDRYGEAALHRIRKRLGSYSFSALYQQNPVPAEGGLFKRAWFGSDKIVSKTPEGMRWVRGYDLAVSTRTSADYTASFRCAVDTFGNLYIADGFRARIEYPEQRRYVVKCMLDERNTTHGIEKALHGQAFVQDLRRMPELRKVPFRAVRVDSDKYTRALAWANLAEEGKVYLVRGPWIETFLDEICRFTGKGDTHDDQVDAVSLAVGELSRKIGKLHTFS